MKSNMKKSLLSCVIQCEKRAKRRLIIKYEELPSFYAVKVINDIIFNEESHFVAVFKEYLIYEEMNEFLKRFYALNESLFKIVRILQFFEKFSKIYPNYTKIPESKYIYKNIKRKQKMIDNMQNNSYNDELNPSSDFSYNSHIFTTHAMQSINSVTQSGGHYSRNSENEMNSYNPFMKKDDVDSIIDLDEIINKIKKAENKKVCRKKDIIGVKKKHIDEINVLSPKIKSKLFDIKSILHDPNTRKQQVKLPQNSKIRIGDSLLIKFEKMLSTTHTGNSVGKNGLKSDRIVSPTTNRKPMNYTTANSLNKRKQTINHKSNLNSNKKRNLIHGYNANANTNNFNHISNNNQSKNSKNICNNSSSISTQIGTNPKSKIFSPRNSININFPHTQNISLEKKSRSISKNNSIINNVNIINHVQQGSTQINIYNGTDLLKSLRLNGNAKSTIQSSTSKTKNNKKECNRPHQKFELNLRKIMHKNIIEAECASDRNGKVNYFDKLGMNFLNDFKKHSKMNSVVVSKINLTENKYNSHIFNNSQNKNLTRQNSSIKIIGSTNVTNSNSNNTSNNNNKVNSKNSSIKHRRGNTNQVKLKNLYAMNKLSKQRHNTGMLSSQLHSERNKKTKINFK